MIYGSDLLNLKNWKLTLPVDKNGGISGSAQEYTNLIKFNDPDHFTVDNTGALVFTASTDGATTSGSKYPRSELREMNNGNEAYWQLKEGGTMTATLEVRQVPTRSDGTPGREVIGQIHGASNELVRLYFENGTIYFCNDQAGPKNTEQHFNLVNAAGKTPDISLGEKFSYKIDARGDVLTVSVYADGDTYTSVTKINSVWQADKLYFKAGIYLGVNETSGSGVGQTAFYGLDFSHTPGLGLGGLLDTGTTSGIPAPVDNTTPATDPVPPVVDPAPPVVDPVVDPAPVPAVEGEIKGAGTNDTLIGSAINDKLYGLGGSDTLTGGAGNDLLDGGSGIDKMAGGDGDDVYYVDNSKDKITENYNDGAGGIDTVYSTVSYTLSKNVENLTLLGTKDIDATGNGGANILTGNSGDNTLDGAGGTDTMIGGDGDDTYYVNTSDDVIVENAGEGNDTVYSSAAYTLSDNVENLTLTDTARTGNGNALNNILTGNSEQNTLSGFAGDDVLDGKSGADTLIGGEGNDTYIVDNSGDKVIENAGEGRDLVKSSVSYKLADNVEDLTLTGKSAINGTGNDLDNVIKGNSKDNVINGGLGTDILTGGDGDDKFVFNTALDGTFNVDTITDFKTKNDHIVLENSIFTGLSAGKLSSAEFFVGTAAATADQHIIYDKVHGDLYFDADGAGGDEQVLFAHLSPNQTLSYSDFLIV